MLGSQPLCILIIFFITLLATGTIASILLKTPFPFLVVMSSSMQPTLKPGDLLVVEGSDSRTPKVGEIVVFKSERFSGLVIHRVIKVERCDGQTRVFTKGDALTDADEGFLTPNEVLGFVRWRMPRLAVLPFILRRAAQKCHRFTERLHP